MTATPAPSAARSSQRRRALAASVALALLAGCEGGGTSEVPAPGAAIVASTTALQTVERGERASFTVRLATSPPHDAGLVFVKVTSLDTTEGLVTTDTLGAGGSTWVQIPFTRDSWSTPQAVYVIPQDDALADGQIVYSVELSIGESTLDPAYLAVPKVTLSVTNADDDVPGFTVSKTTAATTESAGPGGADSFTVVLNVAPTGTVTVPVQSLDVTEGKLFTTASSCAAAQASADLVFTTSGWSTPRSVFVCGQQDLEDDGNVTYAVQVGPPTGAAEYASLLPKTVAVTNADDDSAGITVAAGATPLVTGEAGWTATFTVKLNTVPASDVVVPVTSGNPGEGLLSSGDQYSLETVNLTFTPESWATVQTVTVTGQDDAVVGDDVTYDVSVGPPTGDPVYAGSVGAQTVPVTNLDDDAPAFVLSPPAGSNLTVGESGVTTATFSVRLNRAPAADVVIPVSAGDATEALVQGGSPPAQQAIDLTFTALDWQTPQTVTVVAQADMTVDGDQLSTITAGESASADPDFDALPASSLTVTTVDADAAGFVVPGTLVTHTEGGAATSFTVVLSRRPTVDVVVPVSSGDAAEGLLSTSPGGPFTQGVDLTFTNADALTPRTVYVRGPTDDVDDGDRTYAITVGPTSSDDERWRLAAKTVSAKNVDVDTARLVVTPPGGFVTSEAGGTDTFTVRLASKPTSNVTVPVEVHVLTVDEALVSWDALGPATSIAIPFTPDEWATEKQVTVTGLDDAVVDGNVSFTVLVRSQSADPKYASLLEVVSGRNYDDDVGQSQGTPADPVNLDSALPYAGQVGPGTAGAPAYSYYSLSRPAGALTVSLIATTAGVTLTLYGSADFASGILCETTIAERTPGACSAPPGSPGRLYVRVSTGASMGAAYTIREGPVQPTWFGMSFQPILGGQVADTIATVNGGPTWISKVTVNLTITYSWDADLDIRLQAPDGSQVVLSSGNGGSGDDYTSTTFDDAAATPITAGAPPFTGTYAPEAPLSALIGKNANGTWRLRVYGATLSGSIREWRVTIE